MKIRNIRERPEKEEERRTHAPYRARIEQHLAKHHHENEHRHQRDDAEQVQAPRWIEAEEFQISGLEVEEEMVTDPVA